MSKGNGKPAKRIVAAKKVARDKGAKMPSLKRDQNLANKKIVAQATITDKGFEFAIKAGENVEVITDLLLANIIQVRTMKRQQTRQINELLKAALTNAISNPSKASRKNPLSGFPGIAGVV